jgi:hypothetical protein
MYGDVVVAFIMPASLAAATGTVNPRSLGLLRPTAAAMMAA